ncbi:MAG TPA: aminotransferase class III-fold pyridoxal phosphate-dependent enzyme [Paludibacteraceae bacterium]|nr:aminotransferase class III-fold pyridoxal phosphate-dependent enzyme [Paludibacteraceae bacterium]
MQLFDVYPLFDINIVKGKGCYTYDDKGNEYLDLYGGHAVISIGHSHPHYVARLTEQLNKLVFYSNSVINTLQHDLADRLGKLSDYDDYALFLVNSGAEANENALKLASFHTEKKRVIAFQKAFHGRTSAAVRITDNPKICAPINEGFETTFCPFNDISSVRRELAKNDVCAVIIEGIQGVGGVNIPDTNFLRALRQACTDYGVILIIDEIQSGYGRSGKFFAHQYADIKADLVTMAKGMGNGFPIGGVLISPQFKPSYGMLGTTFGGNHLACTSGIAVLDVMKQENLIANAAEIGTFLMAELKKLPKIKEVRGLGLMIGIEMDEPAAPLRKRLLFEQHVFTGASGTNVIRLLPPLCLTKNEAELFIQRFKKILN